MTAMILANLPYPGPTVDMWNVGLIILAILIVLILTLAGLFIWSAISDD